MKAAYLAGLAAIPLLGAAPAAPPATLPTHTTNPAELPRVFAIGIRSADPAKTIRFYREAMGATRETPLTPRETMVSFPSGISINVVQAKPDATLGDGSVGFIFQTADIDALASKVEAAGGTVAMKPTDGKSTGGVRVAFVRDPSGSRIEVIQFVK